MAVSTDRKKKRDRLIQCWCIAVYLVLFLLQRLCSLQRVTPVVIFGQTFSVDNINGVLTALQNLVLMIMVGVNHRKGKRYALILMSVNILMMLRPILMFHRTAPVLGIINTVLVMISIECISRQLEAREREGHTDYLTGLMNRRAIVDILENYIQLKKPFYLLHVDLDDFKYVNNSYGHRVGDKVLKEIAERMHRFEQKDLDVGHLGGDEFVLIVENPKEGELERLLEKWHELIELKSKAASLDLSAAIGYASGKGKDIEEIVQRADEKMYDNKSKQKKLAKMHKK